MFTERREYQDSRNINTLFVFRPERTNDTLLQSRIHSQFDTEPGIEGRQFVVIMLE